MSGFQTAITIADVLEKIRRGDMAMPAIQRDYEWDASRIEWLFDSLMREYPISSFLFWEVRGESVGNYKFYTFLKNYREDFKIRGEERVITPGDRFWAILDGQQRLTSLYIGFYGSYAWRVPYGRKDLDNETSRPTRKLYLNISNTLAEDEDEQGRRYIFQFKTEEESRGADLFLDTGNNQWFRVGRILSLTRRNDFNRFVTDNGLSASAQEILGALADMVESRAVNYYLEEDNNLHKALDIFIRINRGGAQLSISTIILSIAISFWHGDAKRAFDNLRAAVLQEGFGVDNDFILKAFLYLHSKDIKFKVTNFKRETAELMEGNWENLANSITETFRTIKVFGYNDQRLPARNVLMPIIYYIYHKQAWDGFSIRTAYSQDREVIRKWLHNAVVHKIVGASSDAVLTRISNCNFSQRDSACCARSSCTWFYAGVYHLWLVANRRPSVQPALFRARWPDVRLFTTSTWQDGGARCKQAASNAACSQRAVGRAAVSPRNGYAVFFFRPTLASLFVDSGSGAGLKDGSLAIRFRSDSSLRMVGTMAHLCGCPSARFLR